MGELLERQVKLNKTNSHHFLSVLFLHFFLPLVVPRPWGDGIAKNIVLKEDCSANREVLYSDLFTGVV